MRPRQTSSQGSNSRSPSARLKNLSQTKGNETRFARPAAWAALTPPWPAGTMRRRGFGAHRPALHQAPCLRALTAGPEFSSGRPRGSLFAGYRLCVRLGPSVSCGGMGSTSGRARSQALRFAAQAQDTGVGFITGACKGYHFAAQTPEALRGEPRSRARLSGRPHAARALTAGSKACWKLEEDRMWPPGGSPVHCPLNSDSWYGRRPQTDDRRPSTEDRSSWETTNACPCHGGVR